MKAFYNEVDIISFSNNPLNKQKSQTQQHKTLNFFVPNIQELLLYVKTVDISYPKLIEENVKEPISHKAFGTLHKDEEIRTAKNNQSKLRKELDKKTFSRSKTE